MTRDAKKRYLELLSACAMCALTVGPTLAQTTTGPSTKQPGTEATPVEPRTGPGSGTDTMSPAAQNGKSSAQVREAQEALKAEGHDPGPIDGVMGPRTKEALRSYQKQEQLPETGRLDRETVQKLGVQISARQ